MPLQLVRRKGSKLWQIVGTLAGQRVRQSAGTADKGLAEKKRWAIETRLIEGETLGPRAVVTWDQAVSSYVAVKAPSPSTQAYLLRLLKHFGPDRKLLTIDQAAVDNAVLAVCTAGVAPATRLRAVITPVRAVLTHAARRGWCDLPVIETPAGAAGSKRTRWLTPEEYGRLREGAAPHLRPLIVFLACTGARIGEALSLDWRDVDLAASTAILRNVKARHGHVRDRHLELPPAARAALAALVYPVRRHGRVVRQAGAVMMQQDRTGAVFRTDDGRPYRTFGQDEVDWGGQVRAAWGGACRAAGFAGSWQEGDSGHRWWTPEEVTPHVLRHTWASWHYAVHRDLLKLREDGLWSSVTLVERYAKLVPGHMLAGIEAAWGLRQELTQRRPRKA